MFTIGWHGCAYGNPRQCGDNAEADMHQASILFTAAVMAMAGAWYAMQDMSKTSADTAVEQPLVSVAQAEPLAE
jgi:hypothetical protein